MTIRLALKLAALAALAVVAVLVFAFSSPAPPRPPGKLRLPALKPVSTAASSLLESEPALLAADVANRQAEALTMRVTNVTCGELITGSAFALTRHVLITNRHVIAGAAELGIDTSSGQTIAADVQNATVARGVDIGRVKVAASLPVAQAGPEPKTGDHVTVVGYPLGGPITLSPGTVSGYADGRTIQGASVNGRVIVVDAKINHGNSGGPLLDSDGRVVGVIYAGETDPSNPNVMTQALAIPLDQVSALLSSGGSQTVTPCS